MVPASRRSPGRSAFQLAFPSSIWTSTTGSLGGSSRHEIEWRIIQEALLTGDRWIVDGNYGSTLDVRLSRVDTVIILARRPSVCVAQALRRQLSNRGRAVQAPGCPERIDPKFLRWIWRYPRDSRPRLDAAIHDHGQHARVIELASRKDIDKFLRANG